MKAREIAGLNEDEVSKKMEELYKELMKLNAQVATGTNPKSPGQIRKLKKTIARIKTVQQQKKNEVKQV